LETAALRAASGPLHGVKVLEIAGIGPVPFCGMLLADMGADILRIDRPDPGLRSDRNPRHDLLSRGRRSAAVDLKTPAGAEIVRRLAERADIVLEGFRPGVMERLGLGPEVLLQRNPRLVYGRMTGWGQSGPLAPRAGHDLNYIALSGALWAMGRPDEKPPVPLNLIGDFGGGAMYLAFGVMCALFEANRSGRGQVVDAAMVDGSLSLMTMFFGMRAMGLWHETRGDNFLDGAAPFYDTYVTADGRYVAVGAVEPEFWAELLKRVGLADIDPRRQRERATWPETRLRLGAAFRAASQAEWCVRLEGFDTCFAPVLPMSELADHPHLKARGALVEAFGVIQPAPAPRLERTPAALDLPPPHPGEHTAEALADWGIGRDDIERLTADRTIGWRGPVWPEAPGGQPMTTRA
jgi:alpha-methylacyl-CoA racemase